MVLLTTAIQSRHQLHINLQVLHQALLPLQVQIYVINLLNLYEDLKKKTAYEKELRVLMNVMKPIKFPWELILQICEEMAIRKDYSRL